MLYCTVRYNLYVYFPFCLAYYNYFSFILISHPSETIATYVFAQYFFLSIFIYILVGLGPQSGGYGGPPGIFGDRGDRQKTGLRRAAAVLIMSDSN